MFHFDGVGKVFGVWFWRTDNFCDTRDINFFECFNVACFVGVLAGVVFVWVNLGFAHFVNNRLFCEQECVGPSAIEGVLGCGDRGSLLRPRRGEGVLDVKEDGGNVLDAFVVVGLEGGACDKGVDGGFRGCFVGCFACVAQVIVVSEGVTMVEGLCCGKAI